MERVFPKNLENNEIKNELNEIKKLQEKNYRNDLKCETNKPVYYFQKFQTMRSFGGIIFNGKIIKIEADKK